MVDEPGGPPIHARALAKSYGLMPVLRGVDLEVARGECVAILGANGAGKSTLLRLLAGIARPSGGTLEILGESCRPERPTAATLARIGLVAHEPLVYRDLTPRQNLAFFARLYSVAHAAPRVDAALAAFGLERFADHEVRSLSRGTLQRVALARATLHDPDLLLLDEPFTGLDEAGRERLAETVAELRERGAALVLVSHDLSDVARLADRAVVLRRGRIAASLAPVPAADELASAYRALLFEDGPQDVGDRP